MSHKTPPGSGTPQLTSHRGATHLNIQTADVKFLAPSELTFKSARIPKSSPAAFLFSTSVKAP
jgi:hypothetical protein